MNSSLKPTLLFLIGLLFLQTNSWAADKPDPQAQISARLDRIEQLLASNALLDMLQQIQALQEQVNQLQGQLELQNHTLEQLRKRQRALYVDIDQRLQNVESGGQVLATAPDTSIITTADNDAPPLETLSPIAEAAGTETEIPAANDNLTVQVVNQTDSKTSKKKSVANTQPTSTEDVAASEDIISPVPESDPVKARADYQHAFRLLNDNLYDQSIKAFEQFMQLHPNSALSDKAQYWLAETYFVTGAYEEALTQYANLINNYPDSQKLTQAKLKMGYTHQELGQIDAAKQTLTKLVNDYPGTTVARLAQDRLKELANLPAEPESDPAPESEVKVEDTAAAETPSPN